MGLKGNLATQVEFQQKQVVALMLAVQEISKAQDNKYPRKTIGEKKVRQCVE